ncbi:hypothetical protein HZA45_01770, partial [Candidatus Peregrinibacteria bacterium]|nr:hypothetical protein [Candidatus Peregrinibacteria bacterium]
MLCKSEARECCIRLDHQPVARHFCDNRRRTDRRLQRITVDDAGVRIIEPELVAAVDDQKIRTR